MPADARSWGRWTDPSVWAYMYVGAKKLQPVGVGEPVFHKLSTALFGSQPAALHLRPEYLPFEQSWQALTVSMPFVPSSPW